MAAVVTQKLINRSTSNFIRVFGIRVFASDEALSFLFKKKKQFCHAKKARFFMPNRIFFFKTLPFFQFLIFSRDSGSSRGESHIV